MGAFLTNVQVKLGDEHAIIDALRRAAREAGLVEVAADETAERTIAWRVANGWLAIYDEDTEDQDTRKLDRLARAASAAAECAVSVLVHDSDVLQLGLYARGEAIDTWCNKPDYFGKVSKAARAAVAGQPARWHDALGTDPDALAKVWRDGKLFAEAQLGAVAAVLGWEPSLARVGFKYLAHERATDVRRIGFRDPDARPPERASGPPAFERAGYTPKLELSVGEPLDLHMSVRSAGGAGRGVAAIARGPAIEQGLVAIDEVELAGAKTDGRFPDFAIPAGLADLRVAARDKRAMELWKQTQFHLRFRGRVLAPGVAKLQLGAAPLEHQAGAAMVKVQLAITAPPRRPLHAPPEARAAELRALEEPRRLFALVALGAPRARAGEVAAAAMEAWHAAVAPTGSYDTTVAGRDSAADLEQWKVQARHVPGGASWKKVKDALATCRAFGADAIDVARSPEGDDPIQIRGVGHGMSLSTGLFADDAKVAPQLALWIDLHGIDGPRAAAMVGALRAIVDRAMQDGKGLQALVGRWDWKPSFLGAETTPYEIACNIRRDHTSRVRCARWLRGVTGDAMWLGPALAAELGDRDRAALNACAEVERHAGGLRVIPRAPVDLDALERALEPILPRPGATA